MASPKKIGPHNLTVSLVIVNFNSGDLLNQCIAQLEKQTVTPKQIFVVDNFSTDNSALQFRSSDKVIFYPMSKNLGFAAGNNRAFEDCDGDFIVLLNPDAFPEPDWLEQLLLAAEAHPEAAIFGSRQLSHSSPVVLDGIGDIYHMSGLVWRDGHGREQANDDLVAREIFSPCAAASMYKRAALAEVGGFDEDYFCYVEDVDLGFRLRLAGYKARYVPDAVVYHVGSATTGGQHSDFTMYHGHRNLVWTFVKNMPGSLFWLLLPMHLLLNLFSIVWYLLHGKGNVILKAKYDAMLRLPAMWQKRKKIQKNRVASITEIWSLLDKRLYKIKNR